MGRKKSSDNWYETVLPGNYARLATLAVGEVTVQPKAAAQILAERMPRNRPIVKRQIALLSAQMPLELTGQPIIFDWDGNLIDGQHRLRVCADSGVPFAAVVVLGVDPAVFEYLDQHSKRGLGAILAINKEPAYNILAGSLNIVANFFWRGMPTGAGAGISRPNHELLQLLEDNPDLRNSAQWIAGHPGRLRTSLFSGTSLPAALHYLFACVDTEASTEFWTALLLNEFDSGETWAAPRKLFNRLVDNQASRTDKLTRTTVSAFCIKTWNAFRKAETIGNLQFRAKEKFPEIAGWTYNDSLPVAAPNWKPPELEEEN